MSEPSQGAARRWRLPGVMALGLVLLLGLLLCWRGTGPAPAVGDQSLSQSGSRRLRGGEEPAPPERSQRRRELAAKVAELSEEQRQVQGLVQPPADTFTLDNGLTVWVLEDHSAPTLSAHLVVRNGAAHDPEGLEGAAHLLEHLLFQGSDRLGTFDGRAELRVFDQLWPALEQLAVEGPDANHALIARVHALEQEAKGYGVPNEVLRLTQELGAAKANAMTTLEYTDYYALLPANTLEPWLRMWADLFEMPALRSFGSEREVVATEVKQRRAYSGDVGVVLRRAVFGAHPYAAALGGSTRSLAQISPLALVELLDQRYVPENAALIVVGDVNPASARAQIEDAFGGMPARTAVMPEVSPPAAPVSQVVPAGRAGLAWSIVQPKPGEIQALQVAATWVAGQLKSKAINPHIQWQRYSQASLLLITGTSLEGRPDAVLPAIRGLVQDLDGGLSPKALRAARRSLQIAEMERFESQSGRARALVQGFARGQSLDDMQQERLALALLTVDQLRDAVRHHLSGPLELSATRKPALSVREARDHWGRHRVKDPGVHSAFYGELLQIPLDPLPDQWLEAGVDYTLASQGRVVAVPNPSNALFQLDLVWPLGWRDEPLLCQAVYHWTQESKVVLSVALAEQGVRFGTSCDAEQFMVRIQGLEPAQPEALASVLAAIQQPEVTRNSPVTSRRVHDDEEAALRYGAGAWRPPTKAALKAVSPVQLNGVLRQAVAYAPSAYYSGLQDVDAIAMQLPGGLPPPERQALAPAIPVQRSLLLRRRSSRWESSVVDVVRWGEPYDPAREGLYATYDAALSGSGGDLFASLRGQGLVYTPKAEYHRGKVGERNYLMVHASTRRDPALVVEALIELLEGGVSGETFARARSTAQARSWSAHVPFRERALVMRGWMARGIPADPRELAYSQLEDIDAAAFSAFLALDHAQPLTFLVVADPSKYDLSRLEALAAVSPF